MRASDATERFMLSQNVAWSDAGLPTILSLSRSWPELSDDEAPPELPGCSPKIAPFRQQDCKIYHDCPSAKIADLTGHTLYT